MAQIFATLLVFLLPFAGPCSDFALPEDAEILRPFAPIGRWAGHWGVDIAAPVGSEVEAIASGIVLFAGVVVSNVTVSVYHGGGIVSSYSYLDQILVRRGERIWRGSAVGISGIHDGRDAYQISFRISGRYVDPEMISRCPGAPADGLFLDVPASTYPGVSAGNPRRYLRPATHRPSHHGQGRLRPTWA